MCTITLEHNNDCRYSRDQLLKVPSKARRSSNSRHRASHYAIELFEPFFTIMLFNSGLRRNLNALETTTIGCKICCWTIKPALLYFDTFVVKPVNIYVSASVCVCALKIIRVTTLYSTRNSISDFSHVNLLSRGSRSRYVMLWFFWSY